MSSIRMSPNQREALSAISTLTNAQEYLFSTGHALDVSLTSSPTINIGNVGTITDGVHVGQTTSNTSAIQLTASSQIVTNGVLVQGISTNTASVFIGDSGVTTSTGFELQAGQATPFTVININLLYVIGSNNTDKVCWNVL